MLLATVKVKAKKAHCSYTEKCHDIFTYYILSVECVSEKKGHRQENGRKLEAIREADEKWKK